MSVKQINVVSIKCMSKSAVGEVDANGMPITSTQPVNATNFLQNLGMTPQQLTGPQTLLNGGVNPAQQLDTTSVVNTLGQTPEQVERLVQLKEQAAEGSPLLDGANALSAIAGAGVGVASFFENKSMNKVKKDALKTNINIAKEEQAHRAAFRNNTRSAFA